MPSIPQSLLWISLVVLWLFVLVPMLVNKRDAVKRTSDVALATRVLNTGRSARLIRRGGPAAGHANDPDWRREDSYDDDDDAETGPVVVTARVTQVRAVAVVTSVAEQDRPDYLDVDVVDENSGALPVASVKAEGLQEEELPLEFADETPPPAEAVDEAAAVTEVVQAVEMITEEIDITAGLDEPTPEAPEEPETEQAEAPAVEVVEGTEDEYEYVEDTSGLEPEAEPATTAIPISRERRYSSATAAKVSERKYRFRKNVLLGLCVAMLTAAVAAFVLSPAMWWVCATVAGATVLYLAYLRRQTRIEERLRRRRLQRMARSRLGVENTQDRDLNVVPQRLRQPGAVVLEIDDEDPQFEHLDHVPFARGFDLPRAAGQ